MTPSGRSVLHELLGSGGEQNLAAMGGSEEAGGAVDVWAEVVAVALVGVGGVQGGAHLERAGLRPLFGDERVLGGEGGVQGVGGRGEGGVDAVAAHLDDVAVVVEDGAAQDGIVAGDGRLHGVWVVLPERAAALHVGEEEGDGAVRRDGHVTSPA